MSWASYSNVRTHHPVLLPTADTHAGVPKFTLPVGIIQQTISDTLKPLDGIVEDTIGDLKPSATDVLKFQKESPAIREPRVMETGVEYLKPSRKNPRSVKKSAV